MLILGADTSTASLSVSLIDDKKALAEYNSIGTLKHSSLLIPMIEKALKKARRKIEEIDLFSVGIGPGSFTGLRVGVTAIKSLAIALDKPIIGVPTMDAIAYNGLAYLKRVKTPDKPVKICPVLDAKKKQVYACIYGYDGDKITRETDYLLEPAEVLVRRLEGSTLFLGEAIHLYKEQLSARKAVKAEFLDGRKWLPKGATIAKLAFEEYKKGRKEDPYDLVPMYLYARDCNVSPAAVRS